MSSAYREFLTGLRTQLDAGVPLKQSLSHLGGSGRRGALAEETLRHVDEGDSLSDALSKARSIRVPPEHVALIHAGERSGRITDLLSKISEDLEMLAQMRSTIWTRSLYPAGILCAGVLLPPIGRLIQGDTLGYARIQLAFFGPVLLLVLLWTQRDRIAPPRTWLRESLQGVLRAVPVLGRFLVEHALARSLGLLGLMLEAGLGFEEGLPLVARASGWRFLEKEFDEIEAGIRRGANATDTLCALTALPASYHSIISSGEVSGTLDRALRTCADSLRERTTTRIDRFLRVLPIIALLLVGLIIGYTVIRFWSKMYAI